MRSTHLSTTMHALQRMQSARNERARAFLSGAEAI
jgi:hypothetical protein